MKCKVFKIFSVVFIISSLLLMSCDPTITDQEFSADDIVGTWKCTEQSSRISYNVKVNKVTNNTITITNLGQLGDDAIITAGIFNSKITILEQGVCDDEWKIEGAGFVISEKEIDMDFTMDDGKTFYDIKSHWTKK